MIPAPRALSGAGASSRLLSAPLLVALLHHGRLELRPKLVRLGVLGLGELEAQTAGLEAGLSVIR
jgi:hypothetical protein